MGKKTRLKITVLAVAMVALTPTVFVLAQNATSTADLQSIINQLQTQIKTLQTQIKNLQSELEEVKAELKFTQALQRGVSGEEVKGLQEFLKKFPDIYPEGLVTGYFGPVTEAAVKRFQEKLGLESVGIVGPKTRARLNELITEGAGAFGVIPPGLLTAPGIQRESTSSPAVPVPPVSDVTTASPPSIFSAPVATSTPSVPQPSATSTQATATTTPPTISCGKTLEVPSAKYPTIQSALDAACKGDVIRISAGAYFGAFTLVAKHSGIIITGAGLNETIIQGVGAISFTLDGVSDVAIKNLTIVRAGHVSTDGGGIRILRSKNITLEHCRLSKGMGNQGGALAVDDSSSVAVTRCLFDANISTHSAGGIVIKKNSQAALTNVTVVSNEARGCHGGGLFVDDTSQATVKNSIFWANSDAAPPGTPCQRAPSIAGQAAVTYSDIERGYTGLGNIDSLPYFVSLSGGDFHILTPSSPVVNSGDPSTFDPDGTRADMGVYPYGVITLAPVVVPAPTPATVTTTTAAPTATTTTATTTTTMSTTSTATTTLTTTTTTTTTTSTPTPTPTTSSATALPDLLFTGGQRGDITAGVPSLFSTTIYNSGSGTASSDSTIEVEALVGGKSFRPISSEYRSKCPSLPVGTYCTVDFTLTFSNADIGNKEIRMNIDPSNKIAESNENNNLENGASYPTIKPVPVSGACSGLTLITGKGQSTQGEMTFTPQDSLWYQYTCIPLGTSFSGVTVQFVSSNGTVIYSETGPSQAATIYLRGFSLSYFGIAAGNYTLRACFSSTCASPVATVPVTVVSTLSSTSTPPLTLAATTTTPLPAPTSLRADWSYGWWDIRDNTIGQRIIFQYPTDSSSKATTFRLYQKRPGESAFTVAAEFSGIDSTSCSGVKAVGEWILDLGASPCGYRAILRVKAGTTNPYVVGVSSFPASSYSAGEYSFYVVAVDSAGKESSPSATSKLVFWDSITIVGPTSAQSPVSSSPTLQWVVKPGWEGFSYNAAIFDLTLSSTANPIWSSSITVGGGTHSKIYDGPALDPAKRYRLSIYRMTRPTEADPHYLALPTAVDDFWIQSATTTSAVTRGSIAAVLESLADVIVNLNRLLEGLRR